MLIFWNIFFPGELKKKTITILSFDLWFYEEALNDVYMLFLKKWPQK